jgi:hypothetical protein
MLSQINQRLKEKAPALVRKSPGVAGAQNLQTAFRRNLGLVESGF